MRRIISVIIVCFMIVGIFAGCDIAKKLGLQKDNDELHPVSSVVMGEEEAKKLTDKVPVHLYFANEDVNKLKMEVRYVPLSEAKKSTTNLAGIIVKELINGPQASGYKAVIPKGTTLKSPVTIKNRVATVDLSKEFVDKQIADKNAEKLTLYSIVDSLTELKDIEKVKFTVEGKTLKEYKGSFRLDAEFPRDTAIISKVVTPASPSASNDTTAKDEAKKDDSSVKTEDQKTPTPAPTKAPDSSKTGLSDEGAAENSEETYLEILE